MGLPVSCFPDRPIQRPSKAAEVFLKTYEVPFNHLLTTTVFLHHLEQAVKQNREEIWVQTGDENNWMVLEFGQKLQTWVKEQFHRELVIASFFPVAIIHAEDALLEDIPYHRFLLRRQPTRGAIVTASSATIVE